MNGMKHETSCGAVVVRMNGAAWETLLIQSRKGVWSFPKGHMEPGETEPETALREIFEETGLTVSLDTRFRHTATYNPKEQVEKDVILFLGTPLSGVETPQPSEVQALRWATFSEAAELITRTRDQEALRMAAAYLANGKASNER